MTPVENLVTVIIPVRNRPRLLREAVDSALRQTHRPIEILVVDDGSTDDTVTVARAIAGSHPDIVQVISQPNGGPGSARETGRLAARGEFIQYLDSDDLLLSEKLEMQVAALRDNNEADVAYGRTRFVRHGEWDGRAWKRTGESIDRMFPSFLTGRWWGTSTPLYRRSVSDAAGPWTSLCSEEDWEYDCRIAAAGTRLAYVPHFVSEEREHYGERQSRGSDADPDKLRDRAAAHSLIHGHARRAGMGPNDAEMQQFARALFRLARQCGAYGLVDDSKQLFELARAASGEERARGLDFRAYRLLAGLAGWHRLGRLACDWDRRGRWPADE